MAKGPKLTAEVMQCITLVYLKYPNWRAKEIQGEVNARLRRENLRVSPDWPGLSAIQKALTKIRKNDNERSPESKELDRLWNTASLVKYPIPPEALPTVLKVWVWMPENLNFPLTIREALWVSRLYTVVKDVPLLTMRSQLHAIDERASEITGEPRLSLDYFNNTGLDIFSSMTGQALTPIRRKKILKVLQGK